MSTETVNIHQAKTHLSRLVDEVQAGKVIVIAKAGKPMAKLTSLREGKRPRKPGYLKGKIRIAKDFDAPLPMELQHAFEGSP
jgi:prevent-host-death family protein